MQIEGEHLGSSAAWHPMDCAEGFSAFGVGAGELRAVPSLCSEGSHCTHHLRRSAAQPRVAREPATSLRQACTP
jgi:hypothetical protein